MKIIVSGQLVEYSIQGKGRSVVLLHGWGVDHTTFDGLSADLSKSFQVIRLDFPGFGNSPQPSTDWNIGDYATFVANFVSKLHLDVYALIGHSFGGRVIIKAIAESRISPKKVVLIGSAGVKPKPSTKKLVYKTVAKVGSVVTAAPGIRLLRPALRKKLYAAAGATDYLHAQAMQKIFINTINEDLLPLVHHIKQPALLVWGEDDTETPLSDAHLMMAQLPDGHLVSVPAAGHFVYTDSPAKVTKSISEFLQ